MSGYLSADIICSENCELWGTDNVQGQISEHGFTPNGGYCVNYPSNISETRAVLKIGEYPRTSPVFSWGIFGHVTCLDQSHANENIWWIITWIMKESGVSLNLERCSVSSRILVHVKKELSDTNLGGSLFVFWIKAVQKSTCFILFW